MLSRNGCNLMWTKLCFDFGLGLIEFKGDRWALAEVCTQLVAFNYYTASVKTVFRNTGIIYHLQI